VQAAAITGESMDETRAAMTVMDTKRRIRPKYTLIFDLKATGFRVAEH
jgi:hypothetical protein